MSGSALLSGLVVGLAVGVAGWLVMPGRRAAPVWLTIALGVAAALLGSIVIRVLAADVAGQTLLRVAVQSGFAAAAVALAVVTAGRPGSPDPNTVLAPGATAGPPPQPAPGERREREERS